MHFLPEKLALTRSPWTRDSSGRGSRSPRGSGAGGSRSAQADPVRQSPPEERDIIRIIKSSKMNNIMNQTFLERRKRPGLILGEPQSPKI